MNIREVSDEEALAIHKRAAVLDAHTHVCSNVVARHQRGERQVFKNLLLPYVQAGGVDVLMDALGIFREDEDARAPMKALEWVSAILADLDETPDLVVIVRSKADLQRALAEGKLALVMSLEGANPISDDLESLRGFYEMGVRSLQLVHFHRNLLGDQEPGYDPYRAARQYTLTEAERAEVEAKGGLTPFGAEVVKYANRLGMVVDIAHASERVGWGVLEVSSDPIIDSHTGSRTVRDHPRNVSDGLAKAIAARGGVIGITRAGSLISPGEGSTIENFMNHVDYLVQLVGPEHVGIGTDLGYPFRLTPEEYQGCPADYMPVQPFSEEIRRINITKGIENTMKFPGITRRLLQKGYSVEDVKLIMGGSFVRLLERVLH